MLLMKAEPIQGNVEYEWQLKAVYCSTEEDKQMNSKNLKFFFYMIIQVIIKSYNKSYILNTYLML